VRQLDPAVKESLRDLIQQRIAPLDAPAAQKAALLAAQRKAQGRPVDLRDTLIAGIALAQQAQLATRNVRHFNDTGLSLVNPFPRMPALVGTTKKPGRTADPVQPHPPQPSGAAGAVARSCASIKTCLTVDAWMSQPFPLSTRW